MQLGRRQEGGLRCNNQCALLEFHCWVRPTARFIRRQPLFASSVWLHWSISSCSLFISTDSLGATSLSTSARALLLRFNMQRYWVRLKLAISQTRFTIHGCISASQQQIVTIISLRRRFQLHLIIICIYSWAFKRRLSVAVGGGVCLRIPRHVSSISLKLTQSIRF